MEWRCVWCGKPHEENDPPCNNCGHGSFERAVVPVGPEGNGETLLWVCSECGREHPRNSPPCSRCGNMTLEPQEGYPEDPESEEDGFLGRITNLRGGGEDIDGGAGDGDGGGSDGGPDDGNGGGGGSDGGPDDGNGGGGGSDGGPDDGNGDGGLSEGGPNDGNGDGGLSEGGRDDGTVETPERRGEPTVWVCPECGREHPRNSPPCSRCGNMTLEPATQAGREVTDDRSAGYLDLITVREIALAIGILLVLSLFVLGQAGVIDLPGVGNGAPAAQDVPGDATQVGDLSLVAVENAYVSEFSDRRQAAGELPVGPDPRLADAAAEYNRWLVAADYGDEDEPEFDDVYDGECPWSVQYSSYTVQVDGGADELGTMDAEEVAAVLLDAYEDGGGSFGNGASTIGVDVHVAPDGVVYVTHVVC